MFATIDIDDDEEAVEFVEVWEQVMKAERVISENVEFIEDWALVM